MRNILELEVLYKNGGKDKVGMVVWNIFNGGYAGRNHSMCASTSRSWRR